MPELPDVEAYIEALRTRTLGQEVCGFRLASPFLLRTVDPQPTEMIGRKVVGIERLGKRIVLELEDELFLVFHLMIAGRLHWKSPGSTIPKGIGLAVVDFAKGALLLTEAGKKRRASLHVFRTRAALAGLDPGGIEVMASSLDRFSGALLRENHTLKRALTDPRILSGIGNAYSDEILHRAKLSPFKLTRDLTQVEMSRVHEATLGVLSEWRERLCAGVGQAFPEKVTAFRPEMAVHGRYGLPCPVCGTPVQRVVYAENECNYCPRCQTEGRILADRALSRLLKDAWPRTVEEMEERRRV